MFSDCLTKQSVTHGLAAGTSAGSVLEIQDPEPHLTLTTQHQQDDQTPRCFTRIATPEKLSSIALFAG